MKFPSAYGFPDVFIDGDKNRNRSLHGDQVAIELLPLDQVDFAFHDLISFCLCTRFSGELT